MIFGASRHFSAELVVIGLLGVEIKKNSMSIAINPLMDTLKPQTNGPLYNNTVIRTLAVDGWIVIFGIARNGLVGLRPLPVPSSRYEM